MEKSLLEPTYYSISHRKETQCEVEIYDMFKNDKKDVIVLFVIFVFCALYSTLHKLFRKVLSFP